MSVIEKEVKLDEIWRELEDFALKASGDRKTPVAACLVFDDGHRIFGANWLRDGHGLTEDEIASRVRPKFYDAMRCGEEHAIARARQLGLGFEGAILYTLMFPCPRCAEEIAGLGLERIVAKKHRVRHNGKFDNPLEDSKRILDATGVEYDIGVADVR